MESPDTRGKGFEWDRVDDLYLLTLAAVLAVVYTLAGDRELGASLASGTAGAIFMYVRGKS
jgi:hypothetical protein